MSSDDKLAVLMRKALTRDDRLSGQPIELSVSDGVVTLEGSVRSHRRKLAAYEIASSFEGCRDVVNRLTVEPRDVLPDEEVANGVRAALDSHADITRDTVIVSVASSVVTLTGNVRSQWERLLAEDVARSARGVRDVQNLLVVDLFGEIEDREVYREVQDALEHTRGLKGANLRVAVSGEAIVLSGEVSQLWQKEAAEATVRRFRPWQVRNDILVTGK